MDDELSRGYITFARQLSTNGCYSKAFDFYMMAFEKRPELKNAHEAEFRFLLGRLNELLSSANKMEDIFINFERVMKAFPESVYYLNDIGKYLYKYGFYSEAWFHFQKALRLDPEYVNVEKNLNSVKNLLVERWHFRMLNDRIRNEAYRAAIHETLVKDKDSVLDIGTGTGLLAMYAYEKAPCAVTGIDGSEVMAKLAECITQENGCDLIVIVNNMSTSMKYRDIGGKRSLLLTEMFDAGLFGEHILQSMIHARQYLMNSMGRVIPNKAEFFVVGAKCDFLNKKYQLCSSMKSQLNIPTMNVHILTYDETYDCEDVHHFGDDIKYMTEPQSLLKIDFNNTSDLQDALRRTEPYEIEFKALEDGEINTVIGWFNLYLSDMITITTDPTSKTRANAWQQAVFFDSIPRQVKQNEIVDVEFLMNGGKLTMLPEYNSHITRISPETLRFLNDTEFMKTICGSLGMACVYLGQLTEMSQINIIDLCPFPMFGLQLMKRGAQSLICYAKTVNDRHFFKKVFKANHVSMSKVTILVGDDWSQDNAFKDEKFHVVFCNIFELCGDIDLRSREIAQHLKLNHLIQGGLFLPSKIKLVGQLVDSHWVDINNKVFDENVSNYKIAMYMDKYQVSQNFCIDFSHLEYTAMSKPHELGSYTSMLTSEVVNVPIMKDGHANAILCWYNIELMEDLTEISTNRKNAFIDGMLFLANPKIRVVSGEVTNVVRCVDPDGSFKLTMENMEATDNVT